MANLTVKSGQTFKLNTADISDPDGDNLFFRWFIYEKAGDDNGTISIRNSDAIEDNVTAQEGSQKKIHVVLEVKDNGEPNLYSYRRIIVTVEP